MNDDAARTWLLSNVSRETFARLEVLHTLLLRWQKTINLVAPSTLESAWARHFMDSAQLIDIANKTSTSWLDLGSGAGFPGLVIAACTADDPNPTHVTLVESDLRKCGFLREAARAIGVQVEILPNRISDIPARAPGIISARALSQLPALFEYARPHITERTQLLFPKGNNWRSELASIPKHWQSVAETIPSLTDPESVILRFTADTMPIEG